MLFFIRLAVVALLALSGLTNAAQPSRHRHDLEACARALMQSQTGQASLDTRIASVEALRQTALSARRDGTFEKLMLTHAPLRTLARSSVLASFSGEGFNHDFIYNIRAADGSYRTIKALNISVTQANPQGYASLFQELRGAFLGESLGGPKVFGFGRILSAAGTREVFFIESETLFPHDPPQSLRTFKSLAANSPERLLTREASGRITLIEAVVDRIMQGFEQGVITSDPDFLITQDGRMRWIDPSLWVPITKLSTRIDGLVHLIRNLVFQVDGGAPRNRGSIREAQRRLIERLLWRLARSASLDEGYQLEVISELFANQGTREDHEFLNIVSDTELLKTANAAARPTESEQKKEHSAPLSKGQHADNTKPLSDRLTALFLEKFITRHVKLSP